jgi:hypothetical protein
VWRKDRVIICTVTVSVESTPTFTLWLPLYQAHYYTYPRLCFEKLRLRMSFWHFPAFFPQYQRLLDTSESESGHDANSGSGNRKLLAWSSRETQGNFMLICAQG